MNTEMKREKEGNPLTTGAIESDNELDTYTISYNNRKLSTNVGTPREPCCSQCAQIRGNARSYVTILLGYIAVVTLIMLPATHFPFISQIAIAASS